MRVAARGLLLTLAGEATSVECLGMLLTFFRRLFRRQSLAVFLVLLVGGGTLDWGHAGGDDPGCNPIPVQHDHSAHRLKAAERGTQAPADHCTLCHLLRIFHTALSAQSHGAYVGATAAARHTLSRSFVVSLVSFAVPPRAPPALVL